MLTEEEKREIEAEIAPYARRRAGALEALKIVQQHRGWISDETLREVAAYLGMTPEELDGAASFFNLIFRKPVGRHVVLVCDSVSCFVVDGEKVRQALEGSLGIGLGQTTPDGRFTLLPAACLGCCDQAPALMVDSDLHTRVRPEKIGEILTRYP